MRRFILPLLFVLLFSSLAVADNGLVSIKSNHSVQVTADRLENILLNKGMTLFARINHTAGAEKVGKELRPTELLIFGNPKVGAPLMQCGQTMGIDLPQKALIWQDAGGQVWFSYNDPEYMAHRHNISGCLQVIHKVKTVLASFAGAATAP